MPNEEEFCGNYSKEMHKRNANGRFIVQIPFKEIKTS